MSNIAIRVENLSKAYRIGQEEQRHETLLGAMASFVRAPLRNFRNLRKLSRFDDLSQDSNPPTQPGGTQDPTANTHQPTTNNDPSDIIWALKDVSFEVKHGEVLGIIGRNGAGKSTLLKILSRITEPTSGRATVYGRVGSLLEVGTGFHPDLTGRENVYLNGTILGMKKREVDARFDEIVDFSGVEKFIDTPVKRYSSGMRVRLAFAVAAHLEPEVLIVDEVLAVGDAEFQTKCLGKMQDIAVLGRTVLFVSHNLGAVRALCNRGLLIGSGTIIFDGAVERCLDCYSNSVNDTNFSKHLESTRREHSKLRATSIELLAGESGGDKIILAGAPLSIRVGYSSERTVCNLDVAITIYDDNNIGIISLSTCYVGATVPTAIGEGSLTCSMPVLPLLPGRYRLALALQENGRVLDRIEIGRQLEVAGSVFYKSGRTPSRKNCCCMVEHRWEYKQGHECSPSHNLIAVEGGTSGI
ncbi:MAG: ABC transporter ATP-binding protein [Verrucomicrobiae bacterium]|nr:ABC transporter ATP-binding protein [Verrucomicrobiae bacterium]